MSDSPLTQSVDDVLDSHVRKWLANEPEMETALLFAGASRDLAALWGALLNEWLDALFGRSDSGVAQVKLGWWGEALALASDASPHPLVRAFALAGGGVAGAARWQAVTLAALELLSRETSPANVEDLVATRLPMAQALVAVEDALWPQAGSGDAQVLARYLVLWQWRRHRPEQTPQPGWLPLQLLARHDLRAQAVYQRRDDAAAAALFADLADALLQVRPTAAGPRLRRVRTRFDELALERLRRHHRQPFPASGLALLWRSWRAAAGVPA